MSAHRTQTPSRLPVLAGRAVLAATALTMLGGGTGVALAGDGHSNRHGHHHHGDDYVNSPNSESRSEASVVSMDEAPELLQDLRLDQDTEQLNEQDSELDQDVNQDQEQDQELQQDQEIDQEQDQEQQQDQVLPLPFPFSDTTPTPDPVQTSS